MKVVCETVFIDSIGTTDRVHREMRLAPDCPRFSKYRYGALFNQGFCVGVQCMSKLTVECEPRKSAEIRARETVTYKQRQDSDYTTSARENIPLLTPNRSRRPKLE